MSKTNGKAASALLAVFPTLDAFDQFSLTSTSADASQSFVEFAHNNELIDENSVLSFRKYIRMNTLTEEQRIPPIHLNFEELLDNKETILHLNLSARALADRINALIARQQVRLPKVSNAMLSRLKKEPADTPHKQNVLRSVAFWIGYERSELGPDWNFETLVKLCRDSKQSANYSEGVRIGFALTSRGDVIGHEVVAWLKKNINEYIKQSTNGYFYGRWGQVRSHDITTLYVDFPEESETGYFASYRRCFQCAITLAHQIAIRWALSKYYTKNRFLSIGIAAGEYDSLDKYLLPILNTRLPGDPVIRMTDFARQCLLINDIRVILCSQPVETVLFNGETLNIWWIMEFWSAIYFDFIPQLIEDGILNRNRTSIDTFSNLLYSMRGKKVGKEIKKEPNAVTTFLKTPHNSMLGVEIAKTLYYRRRFWDALEILRVVLSIKPDHFNARTLQMVLFRNLALDAPSLNASQSLFMKAEQEALYIKNSCNFNSEDFFCEYAVVYLAKAMKYLRYMRQEEIPPADPSDDLISKDIVYSSLGMAEDLLGMGQTVSSSGVRSMYLLRCIRILKAILKANEDIFINPNLPVDGKPEIVLKSTGAIDWQTGFQRDDIEEDQLKRFNRTRVRNDRILYEESISLQAFRPTALFCGAVTRWDFSPFKTFGQAKKSIQILTEAMEMVRALEKQDIYVYSYTRTYGEIMAPKDYLIHLEKSIQMITDVSGEDLWRRDNHELIEAGPNRSHLLMTLNY